MKRWKKHPLTHIKRGLTSLFVCLVALLPLVSFAQLTHVFAHSSNGRSSAALPTVQMRPADNTAQAPQPFQHPLISVTFDDGWESIYKTAMPLLSKYGIHTTQYIISDTGQQSNYVSDTQIVNMELAGHEVDSHTVDHADLTTLGDAQLQTELAKSQKDLRSRFGFGVADDFASPYGSTNDHVLTEVKKHYRSHRNTDGDYSNGVSEYDVNVQQGFDPYNIIGVTIRRDTKVSDLKKLVDYTKAHNGWLVITYHQIDEGSSNFGMDAASLDKQLAYLGSTDVRIATIGQVMDTIAPNHLPEF
jgi:peptidoglycan/xylan/chitin deacetylase (PgdA/CDA1 family)